MHAVLSAELRVQYYICSIYMYNIVCSIMSAARTCAVLCAVFKCAVLPVQYYVCSIICVVLLKPNSSESETMLNMLINYRTSRFQLLEQHSTN